MQARVFGDVFGVKRVQPGQLLMVDRELTEFHHDCLTLGGNAGSPVVDVDTGLVLGIHYAGQWLEYKRGTAVPLWPFASDATLAPLAQWGD